MVGKRYPYLDEEFICQILRSPLRDIVDLSSPGVGDNKFMRRLAKHLGLSFTAQQRKRAIQFGSRVCVHERDDEMIHASPSKHREPIYRFFYRSLHYVSHLGVRQSLIIVARGSRPLVLLARRVSLHSHHIRLHRDYGFCSPPASSYQAYLSSRVQLC